jgi:anti-sigma factor RsiW
MTCDCDKLDAYLLGELSAPDAAQFAQHLVQCDDCRETIEQQRWIDGLLRSTEAQELETPSDDLLLSIRSVSPRNRRRTLRIACGLAAAAMLLIAAGWTMYPFDQHQVPTLAETSPPPAKSTSAQVARPAPHATFVPSNDAIVVPLKSHRPNVTVVRVYPTYQPKFDATTAAMEPAATTDDTWPYYSNGG